MNLPSDAALSAYLEEALPVDQLSEIERRLRIDPELQKRLAVVAGREDAGLHSVGVIWRRNRLSCPSRDEIGQFLLGVLDPAAADYVRFHLDQIGCRYCTASFEDLRSSGFFNTESDGSKPGGDDARRRRYFQTSAGHLKRP